MNNNRRRNFRNRPQKSNFRRRNGGAHNNQVGNFNSINGNGNFTRSSISSNPFNLEKTINKFQQLAKDAQSQGDPVLVENYLQHADHFSRILDIQELNKINNTGTNVIEQNFANNSENNKSGSLKIKEQTIENNRQNSSE